MAEKTKYNRNNNERKKSTILKYMCTIEIIWKKEKYRKMWQRKQSTIEIKWKKEYNRNNVAVKAKYNRNNMKEKKVQ